MTIRWKAAGAAALLFSFLVLLAERPAHAQANKTYDEMVEKAVAYLKSRQAKDGTWSQTSSPGITGLVLAALFRSGKLSAKDEAAVKAMKYIESLVDAKEGHIANVSGGGRGGFHKNYVTSVNLIALKASGEEKYKAVGLSRRRRFKTCEGGQKRGEILE